MARLSLASLAAFICLALAAPALAQEEIPPPPAAGQEIAPPPPPMMPTPTDDAAAVDVARLDAWLGSFDGTARTLRYISAPLSILSGAALVGLGIWFITDDDLRVGSREATVGLGAGMIALGGMSVGIGIYNFAAPTYPEEAYARFVLARDAGLSQRELGRFEGEFLAMAEVSRTTRYLSIVAGFSLALGGGVAIAMSATEDSEEPRFIGLVTGTVLAISGVLVGGLSFIPTPYERAWEKYEAGLGPDGEAVTAQVAPMVGPELAGVAVSGTF